MVQRVLSAFRSEFHQFHFRLNLVRLLALPLPLYVGSRLRTQLLRFAGFNIGRGTLFFDIPTFTGMGSIDKNFVVGSDSLISWGCYFDLQGSITIGDRVGFSPQISVITSSHDLGSAHNRVGELRALPVVVEDGVWLGVRCTIMPGVTIHRGAVIAAGAMVTRDVPANTIVGGVPAHVIRTLPDESTSVPNWIVTGTEPEMQSR